MFRDQDMPVIDVYDHELRAVRHDLTLDDLDTVELIFSAKIYVLESWEFFVKKFWYLELTGFNPRRQEIKEIP